jgi:hypothetical protein
VTCCSEPCLRLSGRCHLAAAQPARPSQPLALRLQCMSGGGTCAGGTGQGRGGAPLPPPAGLQGA